MNTLRSFSLQQQKSRRWTRFFVLPLVLLIFVNGCSEGEVPLDPVGQFDNGTYQIFDAKGSLVGEIFAYHEVAYDKSFEYWVVDQNFCTTASMTGLTNCQLDNGKIHAVPRSSYEGTDAAYDDWKGAVFERLKPLSNLLVFRAKYYKHENLTWDCSKKPSCTYSPSGTSTSISMYSKPSIFGKNGESALPFVSVGTDMNGKMFETWFMGRFFNTREDTTDFAMTSIGDTAPFPCLVCSRAPNIVVDVAYKKCKELPANNADCP